MSGLSIYHPSKSIRSRLLLYMLAVSSVAVLLLAVAAANTTRRIGTTAEESSATALLEQAENFLTQLNLSQARENDLLLEKSQTAGFNIAAYIAQVYANPDAFQGDFWLADEHMQLGADGQYANLPGDTTSVFVPNFVPIDTDLMKEIERGAYLDFVFASGMDNAPNIEAIYFSTPNNVLRYYPNINLGEVLPPDFTSTGRPWYTGSVDQEGIGEPYWAPVYRDATGLGLITTFSVPVYGANNNLFGVLGLDLTLGGIQENIESSQILQTGYSFLVDQDGSTISLPMQGYQDLNVRPPENDEPNPNIRLLNTAFTPILDQLLSGKSGFATVSADGQEMYVAFTPLETTGWILATVADRAEVLASVDVLREEIEQSTTDLIIFNLLPISLVIFAGVLVSGLLLTNQLVRPIQRLAEVAQRLRQQKWQVELPKVADDEIGVLAHSMQDMAQELRSLVTGLEERVAQRTSELERKTIQVQLAAEIARDATSLTATGEMENVQVLMERAVYMIRDRFGFYHAGIFLLDQNAEYAVLRAATGEAGRVLIAKGHRLKVGETGIVGYATGHGKPRITGDVTRDPNHYRNPYLPDTRSELALPLRVGDRTIGALDVQSTELSAFTEDDITTLQTMADQLAVAIENARLLQRVQANLAELERLYSRYERNAWQQTTQQQSIAGFRYSPAGIQALSPFLPLDPTEIVSEKLIHIPLQVRDIQIGSLEVWPQEQGFLPDEKDFLEEIGRRISQAMESARLFEESQTRAMREETINLITNQVRSSVNMEAVLQNTVRELGKALGATRTSIQLGVFDDKPAEDDNQSPGEALENDDSSAAKSNGRGQV